MLQTGAKNYGIHLGPANNPQEETAPRSEPISAPGNIFVLGTSSSQPQHSAQGSETNDGET
ncbi:hypothetical protein SNOG_06453 [Parastagonospora nodorum SN15]|uniref:Uncharacterized protein n=1 Tax=Phaeosphaeria nodorum (strain SN15 / ATCC MYA-4574 / FGSC 10173) TaxID=321614 RepID=Q0UP61_PHANO|nr:hypothetical protein SNOG_06453 [Parastagonospora nodorum SN15]EAT86284.1 hypothetical protein SNOG_06453 [Parastagonospora nodorum SN15]